MDRVRLSDSMWNYELRSWLCDEPDPGVRMEFVDLGEIERSLRRLLFEDPLARVRVAALLRELDGDQFGVTHGVDDEQALLVRTAALLERGRLSLSRSVEIMASQAPTLEYQQRYEWQAPDNEIAEADTWIFWDDHVQEPGLLLEAKHVDEPPLLFGAETELGDGFVLDAELQPGEALSLDAESEPGEGLSIDAEWEPEGNWGVDQPEIRGSGDDAHAEALRERQM